MYAPAFAAGRGDRATGQAGGVGGIPEIPASEGKPLKYLWMPAYIRAFYSRPLYRTSETYGSPRGERLHKNAYRGPRARVYANPSRGHEESRIRSRGATFSRRNVTRSYFEALLWILHKRTPARARAR